MSNIFQFLTLVLLAPSLSLATEIRAGAPAGQEQRELSYCQSTTSIVANGPFNEHERNWLEGEYTNNWKTLMKCMADELKNSAPNHIVDAPAISGHASERYSRLIVGLYRMLVKDPTGFVEEFRKINSLDIIGALAAGVGSDLQYVRQETTLLLANVIDNRNLCVVFDHLSDRFITATDWERKGRDNLLSVVSIVAPYAYKENYQNSERLLARDHQRKSDLTPQILVNIRQRLDAQQPNGNKTVALSETSTACRDYSPKFTTKANLGYQ